ncbi:MAG TPA: N-acetyl-gamma-glutamyl-phosphate reductase [bacterium]|nr:N-acetyl-gamma-glutamyl-phosphate reductase [bacterium]HQI47099.1 N-acetyl-gamma-glutamyl-phosphate reductase [bacterium]HQJ65344.1 N-acetyl-gamma-glutamyl-phosphate reductase [bacterium]
MPAYRVSIVGASGYTGFELVKILLRHPHVELAHLAVREPGGQRFSDLFPALRGLCDHPLSGFETERIAAESDVLFFGLPHTSSMEWIPRFLSYGKKLIDLSADYRLDDPGRYRAAYGCDHLQPEALPAFVYGLPEVNRARIAASTTVANPGCFPTSVALALLPALRRGLIETGTIIVDSKTGVSGGGKSPKPAFHFPECNENLFAYKVARHQHEPEMEQELTKIAGMPVDLLFVPHLVPMTRGIFSTIYARLLVPRTIAEVHALYEEAFQDEPFVRVLPAGEIPQTRQVTGSNFCDIGLAVQDRTLILMSAIDNLIKGASGQAVQNMNLMLGLDETMSLK